MEQDAPLYPVRVLGHEVIALQEWQELSEKLLQVPEDLVASTGVRTLCIVLPCHSFWSRQAAGRLLQGIPYA